MGAVDPRLAAALGEQMEERRRVLARGARHVGWKLGMGDRESIGGEVAVGYLTSETLLSDGAAYAAAPDADLHADAEAVVELALDLPAGSPPELVREAVGRYGGALELVDLACVAGEPEGVVAANVFHRAVAFVDVEAPPAGHVRILVNGEERGAGRWPDDLAERLAAAARILGAVGERMRTGDRVITGSIVQVRLEPGDEAVAAFGGAARVGLGVERPNA